MERADGSGFGAAMRSIWRTPKKDESKQMLPEEPFLANLEASWKMLL